MTPQQCVSWDYLFALPMADKRCIQETGFNLVIIFAILFGAASGAEMTHFYTFNTDVIMLSETYQCIGVNSPRTEDAILNSLNHCTYHGFKVRHIDVAIFIHFHHLNLHARHLCAGRIRSMSWFGNQTDLNKSIKDLIWEINRQNKNKQTNNLIFLTRKLTGCLRYTEPIFALLFINFLSNRFATLRQLTRYDNSYLSLYIFCKLLLSKQISVWYLHEAIGTTFMEPSSQGLLFLCIFSCSTDIWINTRVSKITEF